MTIKERRDEEMERLREELRTAHIWMGALFLILFFLILFNL